jgi:hypothetical protein
VQKPKTCPLGGIKLSEKGENSAKIADIIKSRRQMKSYKVIKVREREHLKKWVTPHYY